MDAVKKIEINKKDLILIGIILLLAFTLRMVYFSEYIKTDVYPIIPFSDADAYYRWALDIESGDFFGSKSFMKWPLYAYFLSFLLFLTNNNVAFVYIIQLIIGVESCLFIYLIARELFSRSAGFLAGLLYAFYGIFIFYDGLLIYSSLSLLLNSALFLFLILNLKEVTKKNLFLFGILLGICTLCQANIIIFGLLAVLWLVGSKKYLKEMVVHFLCFLIGLFLVVGTVTLKNYLAEKNFVLIAGNTGVNFYLGNNAQATGLFKSEPVFTAGQEHMFAEADLIARSSLGRSLKTAEVSRFWFDQSFSFIKKEPILFLKLLIKKFIYALSPLEFVHDQGFSLIKGKMQIFKILFMNLRFIWPLAVLGMIFGIKRFKDLALLYLTIPSFLFPLIVFFVTTRYRVSLVPFLIIFAGFGLASIWNILQNKDFHRLIKILVLFIIIFLGFNYDLFIRNKVTFAEIQSKEFDKRLERSLVYVWYKDYQKALDELKIAQAMDPNNPKLNYPLGTIYAQLRDYDKAEKYLVKAISYNPLYRDNYYNLGFIYNLQGRFDEAIRVLSAGLDLYFEDPGFHFELANAYKAKGELTKAKAEYELTLKFLNKWRKQDIAAVEEELRQFK